MLIIQLVPNFNYIKIILFFYFYFTFILNFKMKEPLDVQALWPTSASHWWLRQFDDPQVSYFTSRYYSDPLTVCFTLHDGNVHSSPPGPRHAGQTRAVGDGRTAPAGHHAMPENNTAVRHTPNE